MGRYDHEMAFDPSHHLTDTQSSAAGWQARLELEFARRGESTVLARRQHSGPLRVQKALYPEGREICHAIILHPPAGIVGGDQLAVEVDVKAGAHALLTTPGASKWYRSSGPFAQQSVSMRVGADATLEWLPQEGIVFSGAQAQMQTRVDLVDGARFIGVETICFGRRASGETFDRGTLKLATEIYQDGRKLWRERGLIPGGSALLNSPIGLGGYSVSSTVLVAGVILSSDVVSAARCVETPEAGALSGVTVMPHLLVGRYLGHSTEAAREWLVSLWSIVRPVLTGYDATPPRIWAT
jgi:urease accessory protein